MWIQQKSQITDDTMDLQIASSIFHVVIQLQTMVYWDFSRGLLSALLVVSPAACAKEAHSDGTQSVCSRVASSTEAFQLLQRDLSKISCPLLNYNLPSTSLSVSPSLPPSLCCCQLICVFVCARRMHVCVKRPQLPAEGVFEMIGGARI